VNLIEQNAVLLVTGASGSIGFEIAAQAAEAGAVVGVHGSRSESVNDAVQRLRARVPNAKLIAVPGDFREAGVIDAVVRKVAEEGGRLDAVIHCAIAASGGAVTGYFRNTNPADFGQLAQTVLGIFQQLCFAAMPHLAKNGGTIIGFASDGGRFAAPRQSLIGAAYGGIMTFVRNLAVEVAREGVRVHCISPTYVAETRIFDRIVSAGGGRAETAQDRAGLGLPTPRDIAPMVLFLCGPGAKRITGQIISINGGLNA
jgi:NAD(P)-dependent dehydrogenase (short-subunit alcohol dehydrogenase family)